MTEEIRLPILSVKDGSVVANSRDVADYFERPHFQVLRSIRDLDCSHEFMECNFVSFKINDLTGISTSHYEMTKDGFVFLAMGFTGPKAARFKEAYIAQFNAMEAELRERDDEPQIVPYTPETEARLLVGQAQRTFGPKAAQQLWGHLGLPVVPAMLMPESQSQMTFTFGATIAANQNLPRAA
ncbi:Rha family transcriptional regulator [Agrobacterium fabacearum]|uniref:Rha family transcriptional regulator n=1 Tax=Agrobacterium tumefaciens TaxID=358 RepID=UPI0028530BAE|nr:Rha family transcriptional regulator [Agrobacterium tumefaciens]MDR5008304.1 Rha family transcriptional regulator [Agrobacterium tumefaciens]